MEYKDFVQRTKDLLDSQKSGWECRYNGYTADILANEDNYINGAGSVIAYILGITSVKPADAQSGNSPLSDAGKINPPLQVDIYYNADCRNEVVEWVKEHYQSVTSRLGQPALKLHNVVVVFKRVVKQ